MAEKAAGRSLFPVDDHWAGAWKRVLAGLEPFPKQTIRRKGAGGINPFEVLGLTSDATADEVKRAFRQKALLHHPDRGGAADDFMATKRAYDSLRKR